jgi:hypothetical protein
MGNLRRSWAALSFEKKLSIVVIPLLLAVIGTGVPLLAAGSGGDENKPPSPKAAPRADLQVIDLAVTGGDDDSPLQAIDVTVRNAGDLVSIVKRMGLRIRASAPLKVCTGGGAGPLPSSQRYEALLPLRPAPGQRVEVKLSQQVGAGEVDRFTVALNVPDTALFRTRLYQLDVLLYVDTDERPLRAGTVVASAPFPPDEFDFPAGWPAATVRAHEDCFMANQANFERTLALEGERAPALSTDLLGRR